MTKNEEALIVAIKNSDTHKVQKLVKRIKNVNFNFSDNGYANYFETPLHQAATNGNTEMMTALISAGGDINVKDNYGSTPFSRAVRYLKEDNVKYLLQNGANVNSLNNRGHTPLSEMLFGHDNILISDEEVTEICDICQDPGIPKEWQPPCEICQQIPTERINNKILIKRIAKLLIDAGTDLFAKGVDGESAYELVNECYGSTDIESIFPSLGLNVKFFRANCA